MAIILPKGSSVCTARVVPSRCFVLVLGEPSINRRISSKLAVFGHSLCEALAPGQQQVTSCLAVCSVVTCECTSQCRNNL